MKTTGLVFSELSWFLSVSLEFPVILSEVLLIILTRFLFFLLELLMLQRCRLGFRDSCYLLKILIVSRDSQHTPDELECHKSRVSVSGFQNFHRRLPEFEIHEDLVTTMQNLIIRLSKARPIVLVTWVEHLQKVSRRIAGKTAQIGW